MLPPQTIFGVGKPPQRIMFAGGMAVGIGLTVIVKGTVSPGQL